MYNNKSLKKKEKKKSRQNPVQLRYRGKGISHPFGSGGNWIRIDHGYSLDDADFSFLRGWSNRRG